ncbi:MAG TPA: tripartite tricarboxylate transporter TctB family protein [Rhizobiales bacterium]|nr:tripartite tricarboxylate transporter TctB family protein [bacterium BMS3Bbin10]HDO52932.1 tripartite tricarboxylate transporter TctB family protein [Hyphomicrobiales bacterium]
MRKAELTMAIVMGIFSLYLMWKSTELEIGWIQGEGPGGGAWPFWLATVMLISCIFIIVNWVRKASPPSRSAEVFMDRGTLIAVGLVAGSLIVTVALFYVIGVYGALPLFMIFYVRFLGRHTWPVTAAMATITPVATFFFFDIALKITLPKGLPIVEETIFYPLYKIFL